MKHYCNPMNIEYGFQYFRYVRVDTFNESGVTEGSVICVRV